MTIALHACCGPCLLEPLDSLAAEDDVVVVYANPNIAPREEYERRRDTLLAYTARVGVHALELPFDPGLWEAAVAGLEDDQPSRCAACFRVRLRMTARWAVENGVDTFATTLTVSPYQNQSAVREAGEVVAADTGVAYLDRDYRDKYPSATSRARELGLYRQNYCGCAPSIREADEARARRRVEREAARAERGAEPLAAADPRTGSRAVDRRTAADG